MKANHVLCSVILVAAAAFFLGTPVAWSRLAQGAAQKPAQKAPENIQEKKQEKSAANVPPKLPAEIKLLETRIRFEANGDRRKEVHASVRINDELGVRQFARLNFDFNRSFEQIEIPLVRITHPNGGVVDVLPSAIIDTPNPAVVNAPAYQDVRVKSVRILGLEPGDSLEYRVITTVTHHPLAPDFWLDHTFDRTGVVFNEVFELDLPGHLNSTSTMGSWHGFPAIVVYLTIPATSYRYEPNGGDSGRSIYRWEIPSTRRLPPPVDEQDTPAPDVLVSSFPDWFKLVNRLAPHLLEWNEDDRKQARAKLQSLSPHAGAPNEMLRASYDFVSEKLSTVDLPVGATGFRIRSVNEILGSGYATPEEKCALLAHFASLAGIHAEVVLAAAPETQKQFGRPSVFTHVFVIVLEKKKRIALDPSVEVAPFGVIPSEFRGKTTLSLTLGDAGDFLYDKWSALPVELPFPATQRIDVDATLSAGGVLSAKVKYTMRGENELLLRVAFHQAPKEKRNEVAQLLALSDGFRGKVSNVAASDPYETRMPFTVEYEIAQPKFVDWSKRPLGIPALLPLLGLPDPPAKPAAGATASPIDLGPPLNVEISATLHLPPGTIAHIPAGTSVERDFATYTSRYSAKDGTLTASRHLNFILKEIPADRAADYNAFLQAVQNDESQVFHLERAEAAAAEPQKP